MRARTVGLSVLAHGILIGAGGCSSESPTSPLTPGAAAADKGGTPNPAAPGFPQDTTGTTVQGGLLGAGGRQSDPTVQAAGGLLGAGG